jgi:hypothetical protein
MSELKTRVSYALPKDLPRVPYRTPCAHVTSGDWRAGWERPDETRVKESTRLVLRSRLAAVVASAPLRGEREATTDESPRHIHNIYHAPISILSVCRSIHKKKQADGFSTSLPTLHMDG